MATLEGLLHPSTTVLMLARVFVICNGPNEVMSGGLFLGYQALRFEFWAAHCSNYELFSFMNCRCSIQYSV